MIKQKKKFLNYIIVAAVSLFLLALFKEEIEKVQLSKAFSFDQLVEYIFLFFGIISALSAYDIFRGYLKKSLSIGITRTKVFIDYTLIILEIIVSIIICIIYYYIWIFIMYNKISFYSFNSLWFLILSVLINSFIGFVLGMIKLKTIFAAIIIIAFNIFVWLEPANVFVNMLLTLIVAALFAINYQMIKKKGL